MSQKLNLNIINAKITTCKGQQYNNKVTNFNCVLFVREGQTLQNH